MGALLVPLFILLAVVVVGVAALVQMTRRRQAEREHAADPEVGTVHAQLPPGHDPAAVIAALGKEGYEAHEGPSTGEVVVPCETSADRRRIEEIIRAAPPAIEGQ